MNDLTNKIDELGAIKAQMADLAAREKQLKNALIAELGEGNAAEGHDFRVSVFGADRVNVDWRAIAQKLKPSRQLVTAHSEDKHVTTVRVSARMSRAA